MVSLAPSTTVAELVLERPARMRLLDRLGIDYCCGGRRPFADACRERGLDATTVAAILDALDKESEAAPDADWAHAPLGELCDHLVHEHHAYLRRELPRLAELTAKTARAHGAERPELRTVHDALLRLRHELVAHLDDEEAELFPACRRLAAGASLDHDANALGSLAELEAEHAAAGEILAELRALTGGYDETRALCGTHRAMLAGLASLERDLHEHIHEENNILFPRALALAGR